MGKLWKMKKKQLRFFNKIFGNIVKNCNISWYSDFDPIVENVKDPTLKAILKYNTLAFWQSELNVIGMVLLVLGRSVFNKLKQKLGYWNWIKHLIIKIYQLKLSRKTHIFSNFICESINNSIKSSIHHAWNMLM